MKAYIVSIFAVCAVFSVLALISHGSSRIEKSALGVIALCVILIPPASYIGDMDINSLLSYPTLPNYSNDGCSEVAEEAFAEGIRLEIAGKFSLDKDDVRVKAKGFDLKNMCADSVRVVLSGRAAMADYRAVEDYLNHMGIGVFKVEIEIG